MLPLASLEDLQIWLKGTELDVEQGLFVLDMASSVVRAAAGNPASWVDQASIPAVARAVTVQLAVRMLANPTGDRSQSTGPFSRTFGDTSLTDAEVAQLNTTRPTGGLRTLTTYRDINLDAVYLPVAGSDKPIPF